MDKRASAGSVEPATYDLQPDSRPRTSERWQTVGQLAAAATLVGCGMVAGATAAVTLVPSHTEIAPGVDIYSTLRPSNHTDIKTGLLGTVHLPAAKLQLTQLGVGRWHVPLPTPIDIGARISTGPLTVSPNESGIGTASNIMDDYKDTLVRPIAVAAGRRAVEGGIVGGLGTAWVIGSLRRRRKQDRALAAAASYAEQIDQELAALAPDGALAAQLRDQSDKLRAKLETASQPRSKRLKIITAIGAAMLVLSGSSAVNLAGAAPEQTPAVYSLNPDIASTVPILKGATVTGTSGWAINHGIRTLSNFRENVDVAWQGYANQVEPAVDKLRAEGHMDWQGDPDIVPVLAVTDIHCNQPYMNYLLTEIVSQFNISVVADGGDQANFADTLPVDNSCMPTLLNKMNPEIVGHKVVVVYVKGNHDPFKLPGYVTHKTYRANGGSYHVLIPLDKNNQYHTTQDGITFVGDADPTLTTAAGTQPADIPDQMKLVAKQGDTIAKEACKIKQQTGIAPFGMGHEPQSGYASIARDCVNVMFDGHWHINLPVTQFANTDGARPVQEILGTASGAGQDDYNTIDGKPTMYAPSRINLISRTTGQLTGFITLTAQTDGKLTTTYTAMKNIVHAPDAISDQKINDYLAHYDPKTLQLTQSPTN